MKVITLPIFFFCILVLTQVILAQEVKINSNLAVEADGTLRMDGAATVWDDMFGDITKVQVQGTGVTLNSAELTLDFLASAEINDYAIVVYQMSHKWKPGSTIYPHIHWIQQDNIVPNFLIQYRWQRNKQAKTTDWTNYKCNTNNAFTYSSGSLNQITAGGGITAPEDYGISDVIQVRIIRDTKNQSTVFSGPDPYSGTVSISSVDFHFEIDTEGSRTQYGK
jgi:hypothetical protein